MIVCFRRGGSGAHVLTLSHTHTHAHPFLFPSSPVTCLLFPLARAGALARRWGRSRRGPFLARQQLRRQRPRRRQPLPRRPLPRQRLRPRQRQRQRPRQQRQRPRPRRRRLRPPLLRPPLVRACRRCRPGGRRRSARARGRRTTFLRPQGRQNGRAPLLKRGGVRGQWGGRAGAMGLVGGEFFMMYRRFH